MPFIEKRAHDGVHDRREPGTVLAVGTEAQPPSDCRSTQDSLGKIVRRGHVRLADEDAQSLAMFRQGAQRLAFARGVRQGGQLRFGVGEQALDRLFQIALRRVERRCLRFEPKAVRWFEAEAKRNGADTQVARSAIEFDLFSAAVASSPAET